MKTIPAILFALVCGLFFCPGVSSAPAANDSQSNAEVIPFCRFGEPPASAQTYVVGVIRLPITALAELKTKYKGHPARPKLVAIYERPPRIPIEMRARKIEGKCEAYLVISKTGAVSDVYLGDCTNEAYA